MGYPSMVKTYQQKRYNVTRCAKNRRGNKLVKYIVIHNTGTTASAKNNCQYFASGNRSASADYFVDRDGTIYKFNADCANYYSWHCGDGKGKYGITNSNSIGIECVSNGVAFTDKQIRSVNQLVSAIIADYGVKKTNVVRHYDCSHKQCPSYYCGTTAKDKRWSSLKKQLITSVAASDKTTSTSGSYKVRVTADCLNIRSAAGTSSKIVGKITDKGVYTIVKTTTINGQKWGFLKSGAGWICLAYTKAV